MEYKEYLKWHEFALKIIGLWPTATSSGASRPLFLFFSGYNLYSFLFLGLFCFSFNLSEFTNFFYVYGELNAFASDLCWFLVHSVGSVKIVVFLAKIKDLQFIHARFLNRAFTESQDNKTLHNAVRKSLKFLAVYYLLSLVALVNGFIAPIYRDDQRTESHHLNSNYNYNSNFISYNSNFTSYNSNSNSNSNFSIYNSSPNPLPYYTYVYCDALNSPCYEIAYSYQIISTTIFTLVIIHCDNLYILFVILCCSEFEILGRSLETLTEKVEKDIVRSKNGNNNINNNNNDDVDDLRESIISEEDIIDGDILTLVSKCVKHHIDILEVSRKLEEIYNFSILAQFLSQLVQLCFQMFLVTEISTINFDALSMIGFVITMLIEIYVFCWCANEIETESKKIAEAAYNAKWISCSKSLKTTLLLVMVRAQRPVQFTVGKFANLSMETLVLVLKGSFSYFMVLREMQ